MEQNLSLRYTAHLIDCHRHREGFNAVCNSTINQDFLILQVIKKKYRRFNKVRRMRVCVKKQDGAKQNNG